MPPCCLLAALALNEPALPPPAAPEPASEERHDGPVLAISSGAALVGSGVLFAVAGRNAAELDDATTDHQLDDVRRRTNAWAAAGTGALAVAGGLGIAAVVRW